MACLIALGCLLSNGCGGSKEPEPVNVQQTYANMRTVGMAYFEFTKKNNRPPKSLDDLKPFAPGVDLTQVTKSSDGSDFVIVWGVDFRQYAAPATMPIVIYEAAPHEGFRFVSDTHNVMTLSEADFKKAMFPPGHSPAS